MVVLKYPLNLQYNGYSEAFIFGHEGSHLWLASICTDLYEWYVENGDTRTLANLQVLQSKLNHPRQ